MLYLAFSDYCRRERELQLKACMHAYMCVYVHMYFLHFQKKCLKRKRTDYYFFFIDVAMKKRVKRMELYEFRFYIHIARLEENKKSILFNIK